MAIRAHHHGRIACGHGGRGWCGFDWIIAGFEFKNDTTASRRFLVFPGGGFVHPFSDGHGLACKEGVHFFRLQLENPGQFFLGFVNIVFRRELSVKNNIIQHGLQHP
jgi:hypothetical protein